MSERRDPYPMASPQARQLAASVERGDDAKEDWSPIATESEKERRRGSRSSSIMEAVLGEGEAGGGGASQGLVGKKKSKQPTSDDIYAGIGDEEDLADPKKDPDAEDAFLDRPLWESRTKGCERSVVRAGRVLEKIYKRLYGDELSPQEMLRTLCLASTLFFMIGGYWLMRSLKDPVLTALCGVSVIPKAKMLSVFVVLAVVSIYNKFLDSDIPRHRLFYIFGTFYFGFFLLISLLLMHPTIGLANEKQSPGRILGWISYCSIESFGSVMVSLFWSFANSNFSMETAKASYGVMVATAQVGSILGPTFVNIAAPRIGPAKCYVVGAFCMLLLQGTMRLYIRIYGTEERNAATPKRPGKKKKAAGVLEGLKLFWKYNYVKGIFAISCLFMVEVTIVDFTMKMLAKDYFAEEHPCVPGMSCYNANTGEHGMSAEATAQFTAFMGFFGQATNILSFLLSLLGTSAVIRYLGLRLTLLLFPSLCLAVIICVRLQPTLYVVFGAMMMLKANSYALNNPTKEMLYQPTSAAVRYKAKSWIDIFGARGSKAVGSIVTNAFSHSAKELVANGSLVGMAVASFLIWNARYMGQKVEEYTSTGYIVGGDENDDDPNKEVVEEKNLEMASNQNESEDTSCAIYDDDELGPEEEGQSESGSQDEDDPKKAQVTMV